MNALEDTPDVFNDDDNNDTLNKKYRIKLLFEVFRLLFEIIDHEECMMFLKYNILLHNKKSSSSIFFENNVFSDYTEFMLFILQKYFSIFYSNGFFTVMNVEDFNKNRNNEIRIIHQIYALKDDALNKYMEDNGLNDIRDFITKQSDNIVFPMDNEIIANDMYAYFQENFLKRV